MATQMFLVMDDPVPEHVKQTFSLIPGLIQQWRSDLPGIDVAVEGGDIDMHADGYVIVFASNTWHNRAAIQLYEQLKSLRKDTPVLALPVEVEVKEESSSPFIGMTRTIGLRP